MHPCDITLIPVPAHELEQDDLHCEKCDKALEGDMKTIFDGETWLCEPCADLEVERLIPEAETYAAENCKLTTSIRPYDRSPEYKCTPEDYAAGVKESYTPNAYRAHCRHNCTNYDELLGGFDRDSIEGQVYYLAIRNRIQTMVDEAIKEADALIDEDQAEETIEG